MTRDTPPGMAPSLATLTDAAVIDRITGVDGTGDVLLSGSAAWTIARLSPLVIAERTGIDDEKAELLHAAFELAYRVRKERGAKRIDPAKGNAFRWLRERAKMLDVEECWLICLDAAQNYMGARLLSTGTRTHAALDAVTVIQAAIEIGGTGIIVLHNHTEGPPIPSTRDMEITTKLRDACAALKMHYIDHILVDRTGAVVSVGQFMAELVAAEAEANKRERAARKRQAQREAKKRATAGRKPAKKAKVAR